MKGFGLNVPTTIAHCTNKRHRQQTGGAADQKCASAWMEPTTHHTAEQVKLDNLLVRPRFQSINPKRLDVAAR